MSEGKKRSVFSIVMLSVSCLVLLWVGAAFIGGLNQVNWQFSELGRQYLLATGMMKPMHNLVDFYTHIKGIEYLICVAFFVAFPVFVKFINAERKPAKVKV